MEQNTEKDSSKYFYLGLGYASYGLLANSLDSYFKNHALNDARFFVQMCHVAIIGVIIFIIAISILRRKTAATTWGFTLDKGCWISLSLCILGTLPFLSGLHFSWLGYWFWDPIQIASIMIEELVFRVMIISGLVYMFRRLRRGPVLAVVVSSIMFAVPHIPTHSFSNIFDSIIFFALTFGFIYLYTRSILLPLYVHVMTTLGGHLGFTAGAIIIAVYFTIATWGQFCGRQLFAKPISE